MSRRSTASRVVVLAAAVTLLSAGPNGAGSASGAMPTPRPPAPPVLDAPGDTYESPGRTSLVSYDTSGAQLSTGGLSASISDDGRYVAFYTPYLINSSPAGRILLRDRVANTTTEVARGKIIGMAAAVLVVVGSPVISRDGNWVAYLSGSAQSFNSIYLWDRRTGSTTQAVSVEGGGITQPALSADARFIAFQTYQNLTTNDSNAGSDVYLVDRQGKGYELVSQPDPSWKQCYTTMNADPSISADGRYVAYDTTCGPDGQGSREIEVRDRTAGSTTLISKDFNGQRGKGNSSFPAISADGSEIAFESLAALVSDDTNNLSDVYAWQSATNSIVRASVSTEGGEGNGNSGEASISANGRLVAFSSEASTLVPGDTGTPAAGSVSPRDVFVHDLTSGRTTRISFGVGPTEAQGSSTAPAIDGLGDAVAFQSSASNLIQGEYNKVVDVFVRDRLPRISLAANPTDFGTVTADTKPDPQTVTLSNSGAGPARIASVSLSGSGASAFKVVSEDCTTQAVYPGDTCAISVAFTPGGLGPVNAAVNVVDKSPDLSAVATLIGLVADYAIEVSPKVGPPGLVVQVSGRGFTPGQHIDLSWNPGITAVPLQPVVVGADGKFKAQMLVLYHDVDGPRHLVATTLVSGRKITVQAEFTVVSPSSGPPRSRWVPLPSGWSPPFVDRP